RNPRFCGAKTLCLPLVPRFGYAKNTQAVTPGDSSNSGSVQAATAARALWPAPSENFGEIREITKMAETEGENLNTVFDELAQWEKTLAPFAEEIEQIQQIEPKPVRAPKPSP
ncbi:MAG: hypothetical protein ACPGYL_08565, partial [Rhodospirillaceae bacterium]